MDELISLLMPKSIDPTLQLPAPELVQYYSDMENRVIWALGEVGDEVWDWVALILRYNREDKDIPINERKPIKIYIDSPGGSLDNAYSIINIIKISQTPVYTFNVGLAASAASLIFLSGHKRFALNNSTFLLHQGSASMSGDYDTMIRAVEDYQKAVEKMIKFYIERTNIPENIIREKIKQDWYMYATDSDIIENGICHSILTNIEDML